MRRSALIFLAAILLPSLGLAWLAIHSVRDQQVVLEHQQAIISQGMTDALAKNIQDRMDQVRDDFAKNTQQLLEQNASPEVLAADFNLKIHEAWPMAEVGFAVNLNGEIYSPKPSESASAKTFRTENDRFLSNRENVEVYSQNANAANQNSLVTGGNFRASAGIPDHATRSSGITQATTEATVSSEAHAKTFQEDEAKTKGALAQRQAVNKESMARSKDQSTLDTADAVSTSPSAPTTVTAPVAQVPGTVAAPNSSFATSASSPQTGSSGSAAGSLTFAPAAAATTPSNAPALSTTPPAAAPADTTTPEPQTSNTPDSSTFDLQAKLAQNISKIQRKVSPQQMLTRDTATLSNTVPEESDFRRVIGNETSGALARFLENNLRLMVWSHPAAAPSIVFGAQIDQSRLIETLKTAFPAETNDTSFSRSPEPTTCLAILDDNGHPVALSMPGFTADWKHPLVATEIGETLPHWEAALYLIDPQQIGRSARTLRLTLGLIVLLLVAAIVAGGSLIAADVRRQVRLAQQKTDFVSNVSHELKTPLTSIRMFADLLAEKRVPDEARQATYLRIIAAESARLTRLINNVLDFARMERGAPPGERRACDLVEAARDVLETCQPHLEASGVSFQHEIEAEKLPLTGDRDALSQIILNLISNAEKYGGNDIFVRVRRQETSTGTLGCVDVLDRGPGIPASQVKTIFEPFHRLDDSLASGIPGSGLGLTLARRMARAHGGDITYSPRAGGGSCFTLSVPLTSA